MEWGTCCIDREWFDSLWAGHLCFSANRFSVFGFTYYAFGFFFFSCLPFANTAMDFLVRTNIDNEQQGRIWGLMDPISSFGYIIAYAASGLLADFVFGPLLLEGGLLAESLGTIFGIGSGRGTGLLISVSRIFLSLTALLLLASKSLRKLES